jgi:L-arabinokinase
MEPMATLLRRIRHELSAEMGVGTGRPPLRISRAPGRLDVMGGIADYTGSLVCEATLDRAAAIALQERDDRQLQILSFNLFDEHQPFTFRMPLDALAQFKLAKLHEEFMERGRRWAGYLAGCLFLLHESKLIDLADPKHKGLNIALHSTVPLGAGVSSSAAIEVAMMMNLIEHFGRRDQVDPMRISAMCQAVENRVVGAPCGIMDQVSSCCGEAGSLLRMVCQPHEVQPALYLPPGIRVLGINSSVRHSVGSGMYGRTRCAAFMGHKIILTKMRQMGEAAGQQLTGDPMNGYLANLDQDDYKMLFRGSLPERIGGQEFLEKFGPTIDKATSVDPAESYHVQQAADHHVLEARRVRQFVQFLQDAAKASASIATANVAGAPPRSGAMERKKALDKAGHLMYASHISYTNDALLGADECDLLVQLVREREHAGLYGAKITGGGSGGTVAVLAETGEGVDAAVAEIMRIYELRTGRKPEAFLGTSPGAWHVGTALVE